MNSDKNIKVYIAGHRGVAGRACYELLKKNGYSNIITRTHSELDLTDQKAVFDFFEEEKPEWVILCAAYMGGIADKTKYPAKYIYDNLAIEMNVIEAAHRTRVNKLLFMGSAYAYPITEEPSKEESLFCGEHSKLDEPYIVAKIAGVKLCEYFWKQYGDNFFSVMPCCFFGPGDSFDLTRATVIPSMIKRMSEAKKNGDIEFQIWGTGSPLREFLSSQDIARGCLFLLETYEGGGEYFNLGNGGNLISIAELAQMIQRVVGYEGKLVFDKTKPDGMKKKVLDSTKLINLGWKPQDQLFDSIKELYLYYLQMGQREVKNSVI